ncbi:MAG TPA: methionine adenosyltransferase [Caldisericia bacterium]|nr:methionine adenosyltransferase [Caldisericia bacterium]
MRKYLYTSESVTEGHPDKIADQIADSILDECLKVDPCSRVACEVIVTTGLIHIAGEITTKARIDFQEIARNVVKEIGYDKDEYGFNYESLGVIVSVKEQSPDIALGVNKSLESKEGKMDETLGAGDQGIMFGYACNETEEYMPMPIMLSHKLVKRLAEVRKNGTLPYLRPDGKSQVTVEYNDLKPKRVPKIVLSAQHNPDVPIEKIREDLIKYVVKNVVSEEMLKDTEYYINPTGRFVVGGPRGDTGLTGRKTIVDTYGSMAKNGGGCFSGKDATKVDRSASYMTRYVAKNIVAAGVADRIEIQIAYAIGKANPISIFVDTFGTGKIPDDEIEKFIEKNIDFTPLGMINKLDLRKPIFKKTAVYGHFGWEGYSWEKLDLVPLFKSLIK